MPTNEALQLITVPHRPAKADEIAEDLAPALQILQGAAGVKALWLGKKFEDRYTQVALCLWESLESSHAFFTSPAYERFHQTIQPALNGRKVDWRAHALISHSQLSDHDHLDAVLNSPAIEVALTKVVEGGVSGYYSKFDQVVTRILNDEPGCDGYFISPLIENPENQLLLINWKSVDVHHEVFEKKPGFKTCIDALHDYYKKFVVPWHIVELQQIPSNV